MINYSNYTTVASIMAGEEGTIRRLLQVPTPYRRRSQHEFGFNSKGTRLNTDVL